MKIIRTSVTRSKQWLVYWAPCEKNLYGQTKYAEPVEMKCRWDDVTEEFISAGGQKMSSSAIVNTLSDLEVDGVVWLGRLANIQPSSDPFANPGAWPIKRAGKTRTLKGTQDYREYHLGSLQSEGR